jgi:chaperonin cofactor prefoldin
MPLSNMKFSLFSGEECLGYSMLEGDDASMGIRSGVFYPTEHYRNVEPIFRELSKLLFDEWQERRRTGNYATLENPSNRTKELWAQIEDLNLRIETAQRQTVKTSRITLEDHSDVLDGKMRQLDIVVDNETYQQFFG